MTVGLVLSVHWATLMNQVSLLTQTEDNDGKSLSLHITRMLSFHFSIIHVYVQEEKEVAGIKQRPKDGGSK